MGISSSIGTYLTPKMTSHSERSSYSIQPANSYYLLENILESDGCTKISNSPSISNNSFLQYFGGIDVLLSHLLNYSLQIPTLYFIYKMEINFYKHFKKEDIEESEEDEEFLPD